MSALTEAMKRLERPRATPAIRGQPIEVNPYFVKLTKEDPKVRARYLPELGMTPGNPGQERYIFTSPNAR